MDPQGPARLFVDSQPWVAGGAGKKAFVLGLGNLENVFHCDLVGSITGTLGVQTAELCD